MKILTDKQYLQLCQGFFRQGGLKTIEGIRAMTDQAVSENPDNSDLIFFCKTINVLLGDLESLIRDTPLDIID